MNLAIYVSNSKVLRGIRGVFAARNIKNGEVLEECPVIVFSKKELEHIEKTIFNHYEYEWDETNDGLVLGYLGSLSNHSFAQNVEFSRDFKNKIMIYRAVRDIKKDEEITINYNQGCSSDELLDAGYLDYQH
ncbi:SET domain-containing protein-lysine N-methyltransferase [candidate division WWE3 bacterium CG08_land_8_20_14_0_20_41_10]|uniref:SET domain-containing protein-lysine N-methyltransferase n=1 Tax=candidate division WWE3 bacterium CG08_land_8_20_14_0_20_41_10 TaxID=1975085 RepID=A0A2H0XAS2_UNCKA|nr:MAG: SET domain-containing protein-lysine N-methyltransferase [candidate division WWE3 bacterium CG08_land_8_20_14_0_20_41_10]